MKSITEKEDEDEFSNFGKTVADTLRKLPRIWQIMAKKKINDILFDAEMEVVAQVERQREQNSTFMDLINS